MSHPADLAGLEAVVHRHGEMVVEGDMKGVLGDFAPDTVPGIFSGIDVPGSDATAAEVLSVLLDGDRGWADVRYTLPDRVIGLRSGWRHDGETWKVDALENFDPEG